MTVFTKIFIAHPRSLGESYLQHQRFAFTIARTLFSASAAAAVHCVLPCLFATTASKAMAKLQITMASRAGDARQKRGVDA